MSGMRNRVRSYRDLLAWQEAIELALMCDAVNDALPQRAFKLASQIRRAANSVHANIAEGHGRPTTRDYLRHLGYSNASLNELGSHLAYATRRYSHIRTIGKCEQQIRIVGKLLSALISSLRRKVGVE